VWRVHAWWRLVFWKHVTIKWREMSGMKPCAVLVRSSGNRCVFHEWHWQYGCKWLSALLCSNTIHIVCSARLSLRGVFVDVFAACVCGSHNCRRRCASLREKRLRWALVTSAKIRYASSSPLQWSACYVVWSAGHGCTLSCCIWQRALLLRQITLLWCTWLHLMYMTPFDTDLRAEHLTSQNVCVVKHIRIVLRD
jgi:hypothetical protein